MAGPLCFLLLVQIVKINRAPLVKLTTQMWWTTCALWSKLVSRQGPLNRKVSPGAVKWPQGGSSLAVGSMGYAVKIVMYTFFLTWMKSLFVCSCIIMSVTGVRDKLIYSNSIRGTCIKTTITNCFCSAAVVLKWRSEFKTEQSNTLKICYGIAKHKFSLQCAKLFQTMSEQNFLTTCRSLKW